MAGAYESVLHIDASDSSAIESAVDQVIGQYDDNPLHQVLVQQMLEDVALSGVLMTRDILHDGPYIVINYDDESGKTDTVTSGSTINKTVSILRGSDKSHIRSERIRKLVEMSEELEAFCGNGPLDIEFGVTSTNDVYVFQVRRIATAEKLLTEHDADVATRLSTAVKEISRQSKPIDGLAGSRTIFGIMPDWNPAELLGAVPGQLSVSLFSKLITRSTWREARQIMGYRPMPAEELMMVIEGQPYIDVRCSFNSFLPEDLSDSTSTKLVDAWLDRLQQHPELHDKVEFEVAHTVLDFDFDEQFADRYKDLLTAEEVTEFRDSLQRLTVRAVDTGSTGSLSAAENQIATLAGTQKTRPVDKVGLGNGISPLEEVAALLDECRTSGTTPFSVLARHAFIAEALLQSTIRKRALSSERVAEFKRTIRTVLSDITDELDKALENSDHSNFLANYGHLRPGTFDIRSLRYFDRVELFTDSPSPARVAETLAFELTTNEIQALDALLIKVGLKAIRANEFLDYARRAISGREYAKFIFTRNLSDALEWIALWGEEQGLTRDQLANIDLEAIMSADELQQEVHIGGHFAELAAIEDDQKKIRQLLRLNALIAEPSDLYVVPMLRNEPNFVTTINTRGPVVAVDTTSGSDLDLANTIACIESADPGFDWIFNQGISGLVTKYGGANSHMAIRCAEIGLPAAIGCGEQLYDRIISAGSVEIDGREKIIRPIHDRQT